MIGQLDEESLPLAGIRVLDFSQFLAGPTAATRLADLGAEVTKVERYPDGDPSRGMVVAEGMVSGGDSLVFHAINRGKTSVLIDLKSVNGLAHAKRLVAEADVVIESFRPGVMARLDLDYGAIRAINPRIVYGEVTGYGDAGPWRDRPGQDLLVQALSGMCWLNGTHDSPPQPVGFSTVDAAAGTALCQGILACLLRRERSGIGGRVQVSLLEAALDLQFEVLTLYLNGPGETDVPRSSVSPSHPYIAAPYGLYRTIDGWAAIAMASIDALGETLGIPEIAELTDPADWWQHRDSIKTWIADRVLTLTTDEAVGLLLSRGLWASEVLDWPTLIAHEGLAAIQPFQVLNRPDGSRVTTTRCPIRIDGQMLLGTKPAPRLGSSGVVR